MSHTPIPWEGEAVASVLPANSKGFLIHRERTPIALIPLTWKAGQNEANLLFIVRACNHHQRLVNAVDRAQKLAVEAGYIGLGHDWYKLVGAARP